MCQFVIKEKTRKSLLVVGQMLQKCGLLWDLNTCSVVTLILIFCHNFPSCIVPQCNQIPPNFEGKFHSSPVHPLFLSHGDWVMYCFRLILTILLYNDSHRQQHIANVSAATLTSFLNEICPKHSLERRTKTCNFHLRRLSVLFLGRLRRGI